MWVLILMAVGGYNANSPSLATATFNTYEACQEAGERFLDKTARAADVEFGRMKAKYLCTRKGIEK